MPTKTPMYHQSTLGSTAANPSRTVRMPSINGCTIWSVRW